MIRPFAIATLVLTAGIPLSAAEPAKAAPPPAVRPFTTAQLASWLCKGLPGNDGRKIKATLFDGKVPGDADKESWSALVMEDGQDRIDITFMGMELLDDVGAWVLTIELEGDWHGISEEDWVALARKIPGRPRRGTIGGPSSAHPRRRGTAPTAAATR
jgi:hypothetical protein